MLSGIGQGNNLAFLSSSAARPAMVGGFTMDVTGNDTSWERATAVMTLVLSRITTPDVRLLGCIFLIPRLAGGSRGAHRQKHAIVGPHFARIRPTFNIAELKIDNNNVPTRVLRLYVPHMNPRWLPQGRPGHRQFLVDRGQFAALMKNQAALQVLWVEDNSRDAQQKGSRPTRRC
jgi:hypothetical protein